MGEDVRRDGGDGGGGEEEEEERIETHHLGEGVHLVEPHAALLLNLSSLNVSDFLVLVVVLEVGGGGRGDVRPGCGSGLQVHGVAPLRHGRCVAVRQGKMTVTVEDGDNFDYDRFDEGKEEVCGTMIETFHLFITNLTSPLLSANLLLVFRRPMLPPATQ
jgi:hypothetical protein